jgi:hypothetical protein
MLLPSGFDFIHFHESKSQPDEQKIKGLDYQAWKSSSQDGDLA